MCSANLDRFNVERHSVSACRVVSKGRFPKYESVKRTFLRFTVYQIHYLSQSLLLSLPLRRVFLTRKDFAPGQKQRHRRLSRWEMLPTRNWLGLMIHRNKMQCRPDEALAAPSVQHTNRNSQAQPTSHSLQTSYCAKRRRRSVKRILREPAQG